MNDRTPVPRHAGLYRRGGSFQFRVTVDTKQIWVTVPGGDIGVSEAVRYRNRYLGSGAAVVQSRERFIEYARRWLKDRQLKPRTRELYEHAIETHLKRLHHRRLSEITPADVRAVILELQQKELSGSTIRNALKPLSAMFSTAVAHRVVEHNPVGLLERGERPKTSKRPKVILEPKQVHALLEKVGPRWRAYVALAVYAGLRQSEALGLKWSDISDTHVHVSRQWGRDGEYTPLLKTDAGARDVELSGVLRKILLEHKVLTGGRDDEPIIQTRDRKPMPHRYARTAFDRAVERLELEGLTYHQLRHNYASALIASGADVTFVSHQLGHAKPTITLDIYAHEFQAARESGSAARAIDAIYGRQEEAV